MKTRSWEVEMPQPWESVKVILSEPEKILPFFPYFDSITGDIVRFHVPRFLFDFGYEFRLVVGFREDSVVYTFTGDKGILTIIFERIGNKLRVTASWSGFGERVMGKPLQIFAKGIAEAVKEFCSSMTCPTVKISEGNWGVEYITPETAPLIIKRIAMNLGKDFLIEGEAGDGTYLSVEVHGGNLKKLKVKQGTKESTIEADVPLIELGSELFEGLPLEKKFRIRARKI